MTTTRWYDKLKERRIKKMEQIDLIYEILEEWRPTKFPNYEVSSEGRVRNATTHHILSPMTNNVGYRQVHLSVNYKDYLKTIHRLVAEAFIPNPNGYREVNHKDKNKTNNTIYNLEWCTRKYNMNYQRTCPYFIRRIHPTMHTVKNYNSVQDAVLDGFSYDGIMACLRGRQRLHRKYIWVKEPKINPY